MKKIISLVLFLFSVSLASSQNIDSLLAEPQLIDLTMSTPQPRLNETFQISLDINHLRANIFKSFIGKFELADNVSSTDNGFFSNECKGCKKRKK